MAAPFPSPRALAVACVGARASVAVSCPEPIVTLDARRLMTLGGACRCATAAFALLCRRMEAERARGERVDTGEMADVAALAGRVEEAGDTLQQLAQDAELLALLRHRARFPLLLRMLAAMDRGVSFVPVEPVSAARLALPADVVVVGQDHGASPQARVGRGLFRLRRAS